MPACGRIGSTLRRQSCSSAPPNDPVFQSCGYPQRPSFPLDYYMPRSMASINARKPAARRYVGAAAILFVIQNFPKINMPL